MSKNIIKIKDNNYIKVFCYGIIVACLMIVPFIIKGHGIFTVIDDFNYQQIPFNIASNNAIKSGDIYWSWYTELGSNFIGSYSFYTLGSPFFWLSLLFPASFFPYLIGPLLILKYGVAALTAYAYIQRFVKNKNYAVIGALLYAFSGFQMANMMFNHFHDVTALFPLLLIGLEELVEHKRFVLYTLSVALLSTLSFFFFEGQVIFLVIYFCVRFLSYDFKKYIRDVWKCLAGGILGMGVSGFLLVPSILFTLQNPRVGRDFFYGMSALIYAPQRYLQLLKAFFMPAEVPQQISAISRYEFMSGEMYLPMVGGVLVVCFFANKKNWINRMLKVCLAFCMVPVLNSFFSGFSTIPYFRWLYMSILIMALASASVLDEKNEWHWQMINKVFIGYSLVFVVLVCFIAFWPWTEDQNGVVFIKKVFGSFVAAAALGIAWTYISVRSHPKKTFLRLLIGIMGFSLLTGFFHIWRSQRVYPNEQVDQYINNFLSVEEKLDVPEGDDYRVFIDGGIGGDIPEYLNSNLSLLLEIPGVESYHSNISPSTYKFYESMGVERMDNVATVISDICEDMLDFLAVKYKLVRDEISGQLVLEENENYLPFGLNYEYYILRTDFMTLEMNVRARVLAKAVVIDEEQVNIAEKYMDRLPEEEMAKVSDADYQNDLNLRRSMAAEDFSRDNRGFSVSFSCEKDTCVYFSVPYDNGWSVYVNDVKAEIIEANGFMLIPVSSGNDEIRFDYHIPGMKLGIICSITAIMVLLFIIFYARIYRNRKTVKNND